MGLVVTIGGLPGSGKSTLGRLLATRLGVPFYSMGDVRRQYAAEHGLTLAELNLQAETDPASDDLVDIFQASLPKTQPSFVIDSRLGFHFLPQAFKICVKASVRTCAERILKADRFGEGWRDVEEGVRSIEGRIASDRRRYARLYGVDPLVESQYDLILDSETHSPDNLLAIVLSKLRERGLLPTDEKTL